MTTDKTTTGGSADAATHEGGAAPAARKLILASNSPRRRELLAGLGLDFEVRVLPGIDESHPAHLRGGDIPLYIARAKADAYRADLAADELLITADTIVWLDGEVLEKPATPGQARDMLHSLSGCTHQVFTAVCLTTPQQQESFVCSTDVTFARLEPEEIDRYVATCCPLDKAGAYGIQEWIGYIGVESINGSFYNVMGLPVQRLYQRLKNNFNIR
ncbi:MAG: septum formation protein Maf [Bacteroidaceae bacterium]|nr:septum formation protein Maf [Bacteroidaceae bacterium]